MKTTLPGDDFGLGCLTLELSVIPGHLGIGVSRLATALDEVETVDIRIAQLCQPLSQVVALGLVLPA